MRPARCSAELYRWRTQPTYMLRRGSLLSALRTSYLMLPKWSKMRPIGMGADRKCWAIQRSGIDSLYCYLTANPLLTDPDGLGRLCIQEEGSEAGLVVRLRGCSAAPPSLRPPGPDFHETGTGR